MTNTIYTVGHSTHTIEYFVELLKRHGISAVCDVRSAPYSRLNPQFNREDLREDLKANGIAYVFLGKELGARSNDPSCYRNGKVQYDLLAQTPSFQEGIQRLLNGANEYRIALMCAEKDPLDCHRTILVARNLIELGVEIRHILADGRIESREESEERLLRSLNMPTEDFFLSRDDLVRDAYRKQGEAIAYSIETGSNTSSIPQAS